VAGYAFEWDRAKAEANERKHRVTFEEATTVFADPLSLLRADPDHSLEEQRFVVLGVSAQGRLLVVAFVDRSARTRLISARATRNERRQYEQET
jgi:uncharacterized DUF497 family protein